jgi:hypothetical protein
MANILTALDMHIEVLQGLQKVDSFQQDMFQPEEVDLQLNKQQDRFIEQMVNKSFEGQQVRLDYIKNLVVRNHKLLAYSNVDESLSPTLTSNTEGQKIYGVLPSNYLHLVNDRAWVLAIDDSCTVEALSLLQPVNFTESIAVLPFPDPVVDAEGTGTYYINLQVDIDGTIVYTSRFDQSPLSLGSKVTDPQYIGPIVQDILQTINLSTIPQLSETKVYWENYRGDFYPGSFIFVKEPQADLTDISFPASIKITASDSLGANIVDTPATFPTAKVYPVIDKQSPLSDDTHVVSYSEAQNKLMEGDEIFEIKKNVFYFPHVKEPHSQLADDIIFVYGGRSTLLTDIVIDYVRKPRQISLALNQACELAGTAPRLIIDKTIEYLKLVIENPSYQGVLQDNQIHNQTIKENG